MSQQDQLNSRDQKNFFGKNYSAGWVLATVLAVICVYLLMSRNKVVKDNDVVLQQKQQVIDSIKTDRTYLQADFDAASVKIDQLLSKNASINDSLRHDEAAIASLRTQIKTILSNKKATQSELMKAREMIYALNEKTQSYELYIAELEKDNATLNGQNKQLTEERDKTVEDNIALRMAGSVLHASNIRMEFIHERRNGKETETSKAKRADKIRVTFDIDENRIAESGKKEICFRILSPDNKVLQSKESGTMKTIKGDEIPISVAKEIDLVKGQPVKGLNIDWPHEDVYAKGSYVIELYNMGYKIGEANIELK